LSAPVLHAFGAIIDSTGPDVTVTLPAVSDFDIVFIGIVVRDVNDTITMPSGWATVVPAWDRGSTARYWLYWRRWRTGDPTTVLVDKSTATGDTYAAAISYSGCIQTGTPFLAGASMTTTTDQAAITGVTTTRNESLIVVFGGGEDNNNTTIITTGATDPLSFAEHYVESAVGADGVITFSEGEQDQQGATGDIAIDWNTAIPIGQGAVVLALYPPLVDGAPLQEAAPVSAAAVASANIALSGVTAGSTLTLFATTFNEAGGAGGGVSDSSGDTWTLVQTGGAATGAGRLHIWRRYNAVSGTHTVTFTPDDNSDVTLTLQEWGGVPTSAVIDVNPAQATGTSTTPLTTTSGTLAQADEVVIQIASHGGGLQTFNQDNIIGTDGFKLRGVSSGASKMPCQVGMRRTSATTDGTAQQTMSASVAWRTALISLKKSGAAPVSLFPSRTTPRFFRR
jgi:hypothetical protein